MNTKSPHQFGDSLPAVRRAKLDNIALVPASLLRMKAEWQRVANELPVGAVLLSLLAKNAKLQDVLRRVEHAFVAAGYAVKEWPC
jgi:hypothetical protein